MCVSKDSWDIKLIDFGLAQELVPGVRMKALKGTPEFMGMLTIEMFLADHLIKQYRSKLRAYVTRPNGGLGVHWNFAYWPGGNVQVCIFARGEFVFPLTRPFSAFSVALFSLLHDFEFLKFFQNSV